MVKSAGMTDEERSFYFLKFPNADISRYWTSANNPTGKACVAVYFGDTKATEIRDRIFSKMPRSENVSWLNSKLETKHSRWNDLEAFFAACEQTRENNLFVVFHQDEVLFLKPTSKIEDLNEEGFADPKNLTPDDLPLILTRLALIEEHAPDAMDEVNAAAFAEAYKDLMNMAARLMQR